MASDDAHGADRDQEKILTETSSATNYGTCSPFSEDDGQQKLASSRRSSLWLGGRKMGKAEPVLENEDPAPTETPPSQEEKKEEKKEGKKEFGASRTKSNQRWMKLRTTVQLSGAISSTIQKSKPPLKREDSFLKRFSTRQIPDEQETIDTGDDTDASNGLQDQDELWRRRLRRRRQSSRFVVNPDENFYFYWLMLVTICVLYNLWTTIVRQSFPELQALQPIFWFTCDGTTDIVFILDVFVQFRTGYLEQGLMVYDWKKLAGHYTQSRDFLFDILALLPIDMLQIFLGMFPILRFPRFLKTYRVCDYYYMVESRTVYPNVWRVVNLVHILLILAHWFGCFYFLISEAEGFKGDWVYPYQPGDYSTLSRKYLGSLYWSTLTLTTIGDLPTPETNTEYIFTIVSYLIGVFIFATIVGQVGNVITNRNANRLEFERLLDGAKTYMRHHKVPGGMKRRVLRWYDYSWSRGRIQGGGDINTALGLLPDKLKTELALHVNLSVLKKVTIFQECQPEFLHDLVLKMKAYIFTPGDLICRKGEVAREMFIIADGILDVISESGRVLTTMKAGDFFGEIGILNLDGLNKRTADVRSVGYSELFSLSREDVLNAMKDYPEAEQILQTLGRKRLAEARNASKLHKGKDQPASADSGKKIVEKLRSDVKGLRNALRRSRRGHRSKDKQNTLIRMSHVQSSDDEEPTETIGAGLPLLQRLKLLKEKEQRERSEPVPGPSNAEPTQKLETTFFKKKIKDTASVVQVPGAQEPETATITVHTQQTASKANKCKTVGSDSSLEVMDEPAKEKISGGLFRGAFKKLQTKAVSEPLEQKVRHASTSSASSDYPAYKRKDTWGILKKSTMWPKGKKTYLSKSDTIFERRSEEDEVIEKRSRSASPHTEPAGRRSLKCTVENMIRERRRTRSLGQVPKKRKQVDVNAWEFPDISEQYVIRKYDSVDDLSPEYSDLPFVKKLEILNERQAEIEVVRSASLDIPDKSPPDDSTLIRSQSETSAIQHQMIPPTHLHFQKRSDFIRRSETIMERSRFSEESPVSPESNETQERRHLKSILKKISAEEQEEGSPRRVTKQEMRALLRAPTVEGYAARHSKLMKSVTFDHESIASPSPSDAQSSEPFPPICEKLAPRDDIVKGVITGIKKVIQGHLDDVELQFQAKISLLESEVRKRDMIIAALENRLRIAQGAQGMSNSNIPESTIHITGEEFINTVVEESSKSIHPSEEDVFFDEDAEETNSFSFISSFSMQKRVKNEHIAMETFPKHRPDEKTLKNIEKEIESRKRGYVAVEIDEDEEPYNHNWEAEMLVQQLEKQDGKQSLREIQTEVKTLQKVLNKTDVQNLSQAEFRVLQSIINDSDRKLSSLSDQVTPNFRRRKAFSFDVPVTQWRSTSSRCSLPGLSSGSICSSHQSGSSDSVFEYLQPSCSSSSVHQSDAMLSSGHYSNAVSLTANLEETEDRQGDTDED